MPDQNAFLGGRVPLFDPHALTAAQKAVYDSMVAEMVPWAKAAGFTAMLEDGRLVGPFNTILESPGIAAAFLALQAAEQKHTTLSERVRQVVILTVGAVWKCDYERYAHEAVARKAGLPEEAILALAQGEPATGLATEELLAQRVTRQLTAEFHVSDELYAEASAAFGAQGIVDLVFLAGCYQTVSSLLNSFKVPVPR